MATAKRRNGVGAPLRGTDVVVETEEQVYRLEFKVGDTAAAGIALIRERGYLRTYAGTGKGLVAVGVSLDAERRCVGEWAEADGAGGAA